MGGDLVIEGTGSLNLLPCSLYANSCGGILMTYAGFRANPGSSVDFYGITGPATLGAGIVSTSALSSSDSGISFGLEYFQGQFAIDTTFASGASIFSSSNFSGISLASLGMSASRALGTWTPNDPGDPSYIGDTHSPCLA